MKYQVTIQNTETIFSSVIAYAADEKAVQKFFNEKGSKVVGIHEMVSPYIKPGQPVYEIK